MLKMPEVAGYTRKTLGVITALLEALHGNDIRYCHWKSNEHLEASMMGDTDLDILFDANQKEEIELLFATLGFKQFQAIKAKQYKDIVDFIRLDFDSGKIVHLHTHYRLTLGEPYLKGYQPDLEERILNHRVFDIDHAVYRIAPAHELVLLFIREALKLRHREVMQLYVMRRTACSENIIREYNWLIKQTNAIEIQAAIRLFFRNPDAMYDSFSHRPDRKILHRLAPLIRNEFKEHRLYSPVRSLMLRWYREITVSSLRNFSKLAGLPVVSKRVNPRGGITVAVVGADGSGKSTVTANLVRSFSEKLDTYRLYFGRGDGKISRSRKILLALKTFFISERGIRTSKNLTGYRKSKMSWPHLLYKSIEALLVAREKSRALKRMRQAKKRGMLVICDRFPQNQIMGYNDGPLLHSFLQSRNPLLRLIASQEEKVYRQAEKNAPDLLLKLITDVDTVNARKPGETSLERLGEKIGAIRQLRFANSKVTTIDAAKPLPEVLRTIREEIWKVL